MGGKLFKPGDPGGPGRPKGSRNKLSEAFLHALHRDFAEHGPEAIEQAREVNPLGYVRMIAALLSHTHEVQPADDLTSWTDEELTARLHHLFGNVAAHEDSDEARLLPRLPHVA